MNPEKKRPRQTRLPLLLALMLAVSLAFLALLALMLSDTQGSGGGDPAAYAAELAQALPAADAALGAALLEAHECAACHLVGDGSVSPLFANIGSLAASRRPPLSAEQYLYEAILFPSAHLVAGYSDAMPGNYGERLSKQEVGHIIAYLLTLR